MTSKLNPKENNSETDRASDEKAKKEELVEARMKMIRKKNEELMKRQKEIEEDRRNADKYSEMAVKKHPENFPSGVNKTSDGSVRGRGRGLMLKQMRKETLKAKQWDIKRRENIQKEEEERKKQTDTYSPTSRFLVDEGRVDMSKTSGRSERSWGGANFNQVINRVQREKEGFRTGRNRGNVEMTMSGKERREYSQWREERIKIDEERKARQKKSGSWSRAWDQSKTWDSRKKMWVDENDWNSDYMNRKSDHERQEWERKGSRSYSRFAPHDDREVSMSEDWGETGEKRIGHTHSDQVMPTTKEWGEMSEKRIGHTHSDQVMPTTTEEWGETSEKRIGHTHSDQVMPTTTEEWGETSVKRIGNTHSDQAMPITKEEWGEMSEKKVVNHKDSVTVMRRTEEMWGETNENKSHNPSDSGGMMTAEQEWGTDTRKNIKVTQHTEFKENMPVAEEWSETQKSRVAEHTVSEGTMPAEGKYNDGLTQSEAFGSKAEQGAIKSHPHDRTITTPRLDENKKDEFCAATKNKEEIFSTAKERNVSSHSDTPKPQREVKQRQLDLDGSNQINKDKEITSVTEFVEERALSDEKDPNEPVTVKHEDRGVEQGNKNEHCTSTSPQSEPEKVRLRAMPKIITKVERKVTFDSEESEKIKETNGEDSMSLTIDDIPPTPDFLKYDHSLEWGDIEVDADDSGAIEPKW